MTKLKASKLISALEFWKRRSKSTLKKITMGDSSDVADFLYTQLGHLQYEAFGVIFLNRANQMIHFELLSKGGLTGTVADPRIIMSMALNYKSCSLILSHNHPSGSTLPSRADEELTLKLKEAGRYLDIRVLDHIIVTNNQTGYYSFADEGKL